MDISGFEATVIEEIQMWKGSQPIGIVAANALRFQNHLYGCLSVLEMFAEGEADLSGENTLIATDMSDVHTRFNLLEDFGKIGCEFGFLTDARGVFEMWPDKYRAAWMWAWKEIGWKRKLDLVDEIEKRMYETIASTGLDFFKGAMTDGELPQEMEKRALTLYEIKQRKRYEGQTRRRRNITPLQRRRRFKKTRRHVSFDLEDSNEEA